MDRSKKISALSRVASLRLRLPVSFRVAGVFALMAFSIPLQAVDEPYDPTPDTGPHDPLVPKAVPDSTPTVALAGLGLIGLVAARRYIISRQDRLKD